LFLRGAWGIFSHDAPVARAGPAAVGSVTRAGMGSIDKNIISSEKARLENIPAKNGPESVA